MTELKDVIHLYLGCECTSAFVGERQVFCGITKTMMPEGHYEDSAVIQFSINGRRETRSCSPKSVNPKLRPITDILNTEAFEVHKLYWERETALDWTGDTGSAYFNPKQRKVVAADAILIFEGLDYSTGDFKKVIEVSNYLRRIYIDVDGLIESGQAIDATTLKKTV